MATAVTPTSVPVTTGKESGDEPMSTLRDHEVTWDGLDDPENPFNWPLSRKISVGVICSGSQLVTIMSASMIAPALSDILQDLHMSPSGGQIAFSVFFLGLGFAPFLVAPLAETYGRRPVWMAGNIWYIIWNALCPVGNSSVLMIFGRLMSASGASVGVTLTGPVLADMFHAEDRGKSLAIAGLIPYLGPALGPIVGGLAVDHVTWPWLFWILSIVDAGVLLLGFFILHESYAPVLLRRKGAKNAHSHKTAASAQDLLLRLKRSIGRPIRLLLRRPFIQLVSLAMAVDFGIYTLVLSTYGSIYITKYGQSPTIASLHYIAIAVGACLSSQVGGHILDALWRSMSRRYAPQDPVPEFRIPYMIPATLLCGAGMLWYGWAAQYKLHWAIVDVSVGVFTCGSFMFSQALMAYTIDEMTNTHAASAGAATRLGTYVLGFAFPIFAPQMYDAMGEGWGNTLLGLLFFVFAVPIIIVFWFFGTRVRARGRYAKDEKVSVV